MSAWQASSVLMGGLGLFLIGMTLMTDGLKLAAGPALHRILTKATRTRWHALGSGVLVTAMVQSSTAVGVAAIGFVNAGLLSLSPAVWVVFGANVGTTMTGWIVAVIGLKFKVETLALPLVGLGAMLRLGAEHQRRGAVGVALAGFGLLFLGIGMLQQAFVGLSSQIQLPQGHDAISVLAQLGIGLAMTVLMQSSSAAMTITLAAAQSGLIGPQGAAAVVIGANIGSAVTTALAGIGATPNARRTAAAHVLFNLLTGVVALLLLPWLMGALITAGRWLDLPPDPATQLALFHTTFNVLGVLLMWPIADHLTQWLKQRFRAREDDAAKPHYLDDNVLAVPTLALDALAQEVRRFGHLSVGMARTASSGASASVLAAEHAVITQLDAAVERFAERLSRAALTSLGSARLAELLRIQRYYATCAQQALAAAPLRLPVETDGAVASLSPAAGLLPLAQRHQAFVQATEQVLTSHDASLQELPNLPSDSTQAMEDGYQELKASVLATAATGALPIATMESLLMRYSALRRAVQQAVKARARLLDVIAPSAFK